LFFKAHEGKESQSCKSWLLRRQVWLLCCFGGRMRAEIWMLRGKMWPEGLILFVNNQNLDGGGSIPPPFFLIHVS